MPRKESPKYYKPKPFDAKQHSQRRKRLKENLKAAGVITAFVLGTAGMTKLMSHAIKLDAEEKRQRIELVNKGDVKGIKHYFRDFSSAEIDSIKVLQKEINSIQKLKNNQIQLFELMQSLPMLAIENIQQKTTARHDSLTIETNKLKKTFNESIRKEKLLRGDKKAIKRTAKERAKIEKKINANTEEIKKLQRMQAIITFGKKRPEIMEVAGRMFESMDSRRKLDDWLRDQIVYRQQKVHRQWDPAVGH